MTTHPSVMEIIEELGLAERSFANSPQQRARVFAIR
jgi:hypothetical protein